MAANTSSVVFLFYLQANKTMYRLPSTFKELTGHDKEVRTWLHVPQLLFLMVDPVPS